MEHQTVTLTQPIPMPRHTHLMRRGSRYYVNVKVPKDLPHIFNKEVIRKSLNTSDLREALRSVKYESLQRTFLSRNVLREELKRVVR